MKPSAFCFSHLILYVGSLSPSVHVDLHQYVKLLYNILYYGYV